MAALAEEEIEIGIVAFLEPKILQQDRRVCHTQDPPVTRFGPFLCIAVEGESSSWSPVTTTPNPARLELSEKWRKGGQPQWLKEDQYLNDGANLWKGPNESFVAASFKERTDPTDRARLSPEGLRVVEQELEAQKGRRDRDCGTYGSSTLSGSIGS